jgi:hypothetical protein
LEEAVDLSSDKLLMNECFTTLRPKKTGEYPETSVHLYQHARRRIQECINVVSLSRCTQFRTTAKVVSAGCLSRLNFASVCTYL